MIYAAAAIQAGYRIAYAAQARVVHSHNYTFRQQFCRNFDLGVSQAAFSVKKKPAAYRCSSSVFPYPLEASIPWLERIRPVCSQ